ncbi:MAG: mechanosensitive ion channel family protein [Acidobacteria bacterium]|nr:mechanosensitive ion channel family protein [Acidobacteriota bacterium]
MQRHAPTPDIELEKRAATLGGILRKTAAVAIWAVASVMALKEAGFDIAPILATLATAGVAGLAIGFGAQNLVRDVIAGLFILLENQIRVNDVAVINGTGGLVEEINLRTTVLRGLDGTVHIFPNGTIERLSNMTREYSYYVFDIGVAYKEDTDRVSQVVREIAEEMMQEDPYRDAMLEPIEVLGVDKFADSAVVIKARVKTRPIQQWMVGREMNRRMKKKFDELGIEIPFPHQSLYFGGASQPIKVRMEPLAREEVARIVREVLGEIEQPKPRPAAETDQARRGA